MIMDYLNPQKWWCFTKGISKAASDLVYKSNGKMITTTASSGVNHALLTNAPGSMFLRVAGLSGALAVGLAAYGNHVIAKQHISEERKIAFKNANFQHYVHTLALLAVPLTRRPYLVGTLLTTGMILFCGGAYTFALTESPIARRLPPFGGMTLIVAWLSIIL